MIFKQRCDAIKMLPLQSIDFEKLAFTTTYWLQIFLHLWATESWRLRHGTAVHHEWTLLHQCHIVLFYRRSAWKTQFWGHVTLQRAARTEQTPKPAGNWPIWTVPGCSRKRQTAYMNIPLNPYAKAVCSSYLHSPLGIPKVIGRVSFWRMASTTDWPTKRSGKMLDYIMIDWVRSRASGHKLRKGTTRNNRGWQTRHGSGSWQSSTLLQSRGGHSDLC